MSSTKMAGNRRSSMRFLAAVILSVLLSTQLSCASTVSLVSSFDGTDHNVNALAAMEHSDVLTNWINQDHNYLPLAFTNETLQLVAAFINTVGKDDEGTAITWVNANFVREDAAVQCQVFSAAYSLEMGLLKMAIMSTKRTWPELASMKDNLDKEAFSVAIDCTAAITRLDQVAKTHQQKQLVKQIRKLVKNGKSASIVSRLPWHKGDNILVWAAQECEESVVEFLLTAPEFNVNAWGLSTGMPALHCAVESDRCLPILRLLVKEPSIDVNLWDKRDWTPLHAAVDVDNIEAINLLLSHSDIKVNAPDGESLTPLHVAVIQNRSSAFVERLLQAPRLKVNTADDDSYTPLDYAKQRNNQRLQELLEAHQQDSDDDNPRDPHAGQSATSIRRRY